MSTLIRVIDPMIKATDHHYCETWNEIMAQVKFRFRKCRLVVIDGGKGIPKITVEKKCNHYELRWMKYGEQMSDTADKVDGVVWRALIVMGVTVPRCK